MEDQLITFETAKLAKERGFNISCRAKIHCSHYHFIVDNIIPNNLRTDAKEMFAPIKDWNSKQVTTRGNLDLYTSLPTQSLLQKWLRETHKIYVYCTPKPITRISGKQSIKWANNISIRKNKMSTTYETALEIGLQEALKLIPNK